MQTSKVRPAEVARRTSTSMKTSQKSTASPNRIGQQLKVARSSSGSIASSTSLSKIPKKRSPKVLERGSPRSPMTEKHTPSKLLDLESRLAQLEDELKKTKEHLSSSETLKRRVQQEAEETRKQLSAMSAKLEESQHELFELSNSEDSRVKELRKISQERDRVWQSEVEAIQKQHSMDSIALASALNEIQKLKKQLEMASESQKNQNMRAESAKTELENLRVESSENLSLIEDMKKQINECKGSEARALEVAREAQMQIEETLKNAENLRFEGVKAKEAYNSLVLELEKSKGEVTLLENLVGKLKEDLEIRSRNEFDDGDSKKNENIELKGEIESFKKEIEQLKCALEASELRYQEEYIQSTLQIRKAYDMVESVKSDSNSKVAEFEVELKKASDKIEELKQEIMTKETMLKNMSDDNKELNIKIEEIELSSKKSELEKEIHKLKEDLEDLKVALMGKEIEVQSTIEENEKLKDEINKREKERIVIEETYEREVKVVRVSEQLEEAKKENTELEGELKRLKVQSDQWRKAAEQAASMLSNGGNGKFVDRTISLDSSYNSLTSKMDSPIYDDLDDDLAKKKNGNMLKKIGVLWKKGGQK